MGVQTPKGMKEVLKEFGGGGGVREGSSAKLNGKSRSDKWRISAEDNQFSKRLSRGDGVCHGRELGTDVRQGEMATVHLELEKK